MSKCVMSKQSVSTCNKRYKERKKVGGAVSEHQEKEEEEEEAYS